jgi:tetratricopeptide (TPR) repeat protein
MLDKLMGYCERHQDYAAGLDYGESILRYDRAREHTHRRLIRLHYLAGDRTEALRQYERCVMELREELDACPTEATTQLYEQIRLNQLTTPAWAPSTFPPAEVAPLSEVLGRLKQLHLVLQNVQHQMEHEIELIEGALHHQSN